MVRNNDGTGSLKIVQPLDFEDQLQSNGFRFRIQVNDKVGINLVKFIYSVFLLPRTTRRNYLPNLGRR